MIKIATQSFRLLHINKFNFIPPSCSNIESKPNPVINVTLGTDQADFCNIQFRVLSFLSSVVRKCRTQNHLKLQAIAA
jgi:hypothetical protein